eukprot:Gb_03664 [translate_table: standard]
MGVTKYTVSETSSVGVTWAIYFYWDGKYRKDNSHYVSFRALASDRMDVRGLFELMLSDLSDRGRQKVYNHFICALESGPYALKCRGTMRVYKPFFRRATLETSFIKDDTLLIYCTIGVVVIEGPKIYSILVPEELSKQFAVFLPSGEGTDVSFEIDDEIFLAHKLILAALSRLEGTAFWLRDWNTGNIKIEDI